MATSSYIFGGGLAISNTTDATSTSTGALIVAGGVSVGERCFIGGTTSSSSAITGSLVVGAGATNTTVGVGAGNLYSGSSLSTATIAVTGTITSTSSTTGMLIIGPATGPSTGIGNGIIFTAGTVASTSSTTGTVIFGNPATTTSCVGMGAGCMYLGGQTAASGSTLGTLLVGGTTTSSSVSCGGGRVYVGNNLTTNTLAISSTTNATSTSTGALIIPGGLGVAKSLTLGTGLYLPSSGGTPSNLNYYETVAFSLAQDTGLSCMPASAPLTGVFTRVGNLVTAVFNGVTGPSQNNASIVTLAASMPARFMPSRLSCGTFNSYLNNTGAWAGGTVNSSGVIGIYRDLTQAVFPSSTTNNVGIFAGTMVWTTGL